MIQVEIYDICWKIIPYIYYSHTKEGTSRCTAIKRLKQFVGMTPGACTANFKIISYVYAHEAKNNFIT